MRNGVLRQGIVSSLVADLDFKQVCCVKSISTNERRVKVPLFKAEEGKVYLKDRVVSSCRAHVHSAAFKGNVSEKEQKISQIESKEGKYLRFRSRGRGWGSSPMNPNCWVPVTIDLGNNDGDGDNLAAKLEEYRKTSAHSRESVPGELELPDTEQRNDDKRQRAGGATSEARYNQRPWQGAYRNEVLRIWGACAVTGCRTPSLLTASHIKPVIYCTEAEKMDPYNGILLSKVFDALFDRGLVTFENDGRILISSSLPGDELNRLQIKRDIVIKLHPRQIPYLNFHREKIFKP